MPKPWVQEAECCASHGAGVRQGPLACLLGLPSPQEERAALWDRNCCVEAAHSTGEASHTWSGRRFQPGLSRPPCQAGNIPLSGTFSFLLRGKEQPLLLETGWA
ncbi:CDK5 regulatory subunit-associated protein 2-like [Platysternon megacephalum]|uniref:CDK5 regulatory subunit-associated protein 2-like n=1 Tax=Platysternon megacephalum TaxID=55544 RepID=A0A4D9DIC7_9SAUR|nr:CDK5 regulatory subunit-associated protein 2-like [Platysternon megacephalum]